MGLLLRELLSSAHVMAPSWLSLQDSADQHACLHARFWKTWYARFDPFACPPWDLVRAHPRSGLVARPPHLSTVSTRVRAPSPLTRESTQCHLSTASTRMHAPLPVPKESAQCRGPAGALKSLGV